MYYNNFHHTLNQYAYSDNPANHYKQFHIKVEQLKRYNMSIINQIYKLSVMDRMAIALFLLYFDLNTNIDLNKKPYQEINEETSLPSLTHNPLECFISRQTIVNDFSILFDINFNMEDIKEILVKLDDLGLLPTQDWKNIHKKNEEYHVIFPGYIYNYLLYNGILRNPYMIQEECLYLPPFFIMVVEVINFFVIEKNVPVDIVANFLKIPTVFCNYWLECLKSWKTFYFNNDIKNARINKAGVANVNGSGDTIALSEDEAMKRFTWYYNQACIHLEQNGFEAIPMKDFVNLQNSYFDCKKRYMEMVNNKDPYELVNKISGEAEGGGNEEVLLKEALAVLQARLNHNKKSKEDEEDEKRIMAMIKDKKEEKKEEEDNINNNSKDNNINNNNNDNDDNKYNDLSKFIISPRKT